MEVEVTTHTGDCPICSQPWDHKFMLCCDKCDRWFHGQCQGQFKDRKNRQWHCSLCSGWPYGEWQPLQRKTNAIDDNPLQSTNKVTKKRVKNETEVTGNGDVLKMSAEKAQPTEKSKVPLAPSSPVKEGCLVADATEVTRSELHTKDPSKKSKVVRKLSLRCSPSVSESGSLSSDFETPPKKKKYSVTAKELHKKDPSTKSNVVRKLSLRCSPSVSESGSFSSDFETPPKKKKYSVTAKLH